MSFESGVNPQIHVPTYWFKFLVAKSRLLIVLMDRLVFWFAVKTILSTDTWTGRNIASLFHGGDTLLKILSGASLS
jgi:hypothetical protein